MPSSFASSCRSRQAGLRDGRCKVGGEDNKYAWSGKIEKFKYKEFSSGLPFSVVRSLPQRPREVHRHDFSEIVVVTRGVGIHVSHHESWPVQAGDVFVIGGRQAHYYDDVHELDLVNVLFQRDSLSLNIHDIGTLSGFHALFGMSEMRARPDFHSRFRLQAKDLTVMQAYIDVLEQELASDNAAKAYFAHAYFMLIVGSLSRLYSQQRNFDSLAVLSIARAVNHIEENFSEPMNLALLASMVGMTERTFLRTFHRATGSSPHSYLLKVRINRAAAELHKADRQITEIAFEAGFNDSSYFTRQFKQHMGITPLEYRKEIQCGFHMFPRKQE